MHTFYTFLAYPLVHSLSVLLYSRFVAFCRAMCLFASGYKPFAIPSRRCTQRSKMSSDCASTKVRGLHAEVKAAHLNKELPTVHQLGDWRCAL